MASRVDDLANEIASLGENEQKRLWEHVADLNLRQGLHTLSERYRERLRQNGELDSSVEEILSELSQIREEIAAYDYPG